MEQDGLIVQKAINTLITDDKLKRQGEASVIASESRIKGLLQFINEKEIITPREVQ